MVDMASTRTPSRWFTMGQKFFDRGRFSAAVWCLSRAIKSSLNPEAYLLRGKAYTEQNNLQKAMADFNQAIKMDAGFADGFNCRGTIYSMQGLFDKALVDYEKAIELNPQVFKFHHNRGTAYGSLGNYSEAIKSFLKATELSDSAVSTYYLGMTYARMEDNPKATEQYNKAIKLDPTYAEPYVGLGIISQSQENDEAAKQYYTKAIALNPKCAGAYQGRSILLAEEEKDKKQEKRDYTHAYRDAKKALELSPNDIANIINYGVLSAASGWPYSSSAESYFTKALSMNPQSIHALLGRAAWYQENDKQELAIKDLDKVIQLEPNNAWAYYLRGISYYGLDRWKSDRDLMYAAELNPDDDVVIVSILAILCGNHRNQDALVFCDRIINVSPDDAGMYYIRGYIRFLSRQSREDVEQAISDYKVSYEMRKQKDPQKAQDALNDIEIAESVLRDDRGISTHQGRRDSGYIKNLPPITPQHIQKSSPASSKNWGFSGIAGMETVKKKLADKVIDPIKNPEKFKALKVKPVSGVLIGGPPGGGKTFLAKKLSEELNAPFMEVRASDLATPYIHGAVSNIKRVFGEAAEKAKRNGGVCVLAINEVEGLIIDRKKARTEDFTYIKETEEFLHQLETAAERGILVVGTTNFPEKMDDAIIRPGRFSLKIDMPLPDEELRKELFIQSLSDRPCSADINFDELAKLSEGLSCADIIDGIVEATASKAANQSLSAISMNLLKETLIVLPSKSRPPMPPN